MNAELKEYYDDMLKMSKLYDALGGRSCTIGPPATEAELAEWEQQIGHALPPDYKDWLRLTKNLWMDGGCFELSSPYWSDGDDEICIGSVIGDGEDFYYNFTDEQYFRDFEGEIEEYDTFTDLLDSFCCDMEIMLDSQFGDRWKQVYDELFPEE